MTPLVFSSGRRVLMLKRRRVLMLICLTQPKTPLTCYKLSIFLAYCNKLQQTCQFLWSYNKSVKIKLVATCHLQTCYHLLKWLEINFQEVCWQLITHLSSARRRKPCERVLIVRQLEADILTISRGNSILVLSCFFKVSKYISECRPRWNFLWALANTFFVNITIKLLLSKKVIFQVQFKNKWLTSWESS